MRRRSALIGTLGLLAACTSGQPVAPPGPVYSVWLHDDYYWYDDDFWIWVDDNPDCCADPEDLREALERWWNGLPPDQQAKIKERVEDWLEAHDLRPSSREEARDLVFDTVRDRWAAMTPEERRDWLDGRGERARARLAERSGVDPLTIERDQLRARAEGWRADLTPEQRTELARRAEARRAVVNHPTPQADRTAGRVSFERGGLAGGGRGGGRGR